MLSVSNTIINEKTLKRLCKKLCHCSPPGKKIIEESSAVASKDETCQEKAEYIHLKGELNTHIAYT